MQFAIVELSGRHHFFTNATDATTVRDVKLFLAPRLGLPESSLNRMVLIYAGNEVEDTQLISSLGLTESTQDNFRMHVAVRLEVSQGLFDGQPHPLLLNDLAIGGPSEYDDIAMSIGTFADFLNELGLSDEEQTRIRGTVDQNVENILTQFEQENNIRFPRCIRELFTTIDLPNYCCQLLAMNPMLSIEQLTTKYLEEPILVSIDENKSAFLFMYDHQGCCYWYIVWSHSDEEISDCKVYVLPGGAEFDLHETTYLTSNHFWQFMIDYARKSRLS